MTDYAMNYGSTIPIESRIAWQKRLNMTQQALKDNLLARNLLPVRELPTTVDIDRVTRVEGSGGNASIHATITAVGSVPETTDIGVGTEDFKQYQISLGFNVTGRELMQDPALKNSKVDWCTRNIHRLEDYVFFNGDAKNNIVGLQTRAQSNPNGKIVASGASGSDANNVGAWAGTDATIDIYHDINEAMSRIGDNFANSPMYLVGKRADLKYIRDLDDMRKSYADEIMDLFGANSVNDFLRYSSYCPTGYVYIVAKNPEIAEFTMSQPLIVDTDFPKEKGNIYWTELREIVNPYQCYDLEGSVEIAIG